MTAYEFRQTQSYKDAVNKIRNYRAGFEFTIEFWQIPKAKANGLEIVLQDCIDSGLIKSVSMSFDLDFEKTEERYIRCAATS